MLEVRIAFWRYARLLISTVDHQKINKLKQRYDYLFLVVYNKVTLSDFKVESRQSLIIDLDSGLDSVWQGFRHNTRNEIRRVEENENLSFIDLDAHLDQVYTAYSHFERKRQWRPALRREIETSLIFSAYYKNKIVAGIICYAHESTIRVSKIFSIRNCNNETEIKNTLIGQATRKLIWQVCQYGIKNKYNFLDLGGVNFTDPKKIGISHFKQSFGGRISEVSVCRYSTKFFSLLRKAAFYFGKDIT